MIDIDKDIKILVYLKGDSKTKIRATIDLIIGDLVKVRSFKIIQAANGSLYVVNPAIAETIFNKIEGRKEVSYVSSASLLPCEDRKKLVDKIIDAYAAELERVKRKTEGRVARCLGVGNETGTIAERKI